jgi:uncharacterized membrane protein
MSTSRRSRLSVWWWELSYRIGPNLWVAPLLMSIGALALFAVTRRLDTAYAGDTSQLPEFLVTRSPADAALILTALLSAVATALALVFSTSILTLSLAQSQLGPRLIRRFMRDPVTQVTLGAFLSTLIYLVLTLASNRTGDVDGVPEFSVAASILLTFACFGLLVLFVHRVASTIQSPNVVASVVGDLSGSLGELDGYLTDVPRSTDTALISRTVASSRVRGGEVLATTSGYVDLMDHTRLLHAADRAGAVVVVARRPGQFVVTGQALAHVLPAEAATHVQHAVLASIEIGPARTLRQDLEFAIAQMVEIAIRALSPAINDTYTGLTCVDWLGDALVRMGARPADSGGWSNDAGELRLVVPALRFERVLKSAFDLIRQAGADSPAVLIRILDALATMAPMVRPEHLGALRTQADLIVETARAQGFVSGDLADIDERYHRALASFGE